MAEAIRIAAPPITTTTTQSIGCNDSGANRLPLGRTRRRAQRFLDHFDPPQSHRSAQDLKEKAERRTAQPGRP